MAILICTWLNRFTRNGLELGTCPHCGYEGATFRLRVCPKG
jgi:hypothetical protein